MSAGRNRIRLSAALVATVLAACAAASGRATGTHEASIDPRSQQAHPAVLPAGTAPGHPIELRVEVDADGGILDVALVHSSGSRALDIAAMDAARRWTYRPATRDGQPVPGAIRFAVPFSD